MKSLISILLISIFAFSLSVFAGINLNTATQSELESLPGIGSKTAKEIMAKRPFQSVDDLKDVKGISAGKFEKLHGLVEVNEAAATTTSTTSTTKTSTMMSNKARGMAAGKLGADEKISLNSASLDQLEKLPGIGPKKAEAIINARPFQSIDDVMKVKGIKAGTFNKIKEHLTL